MTTELNPLEEIPTLETYQTDKTPSMWKWYFGWHPRLFFTVPIFLVFVYQGISYIFSELGDVIRFFQKTPITWASIFLVIIFGSILFWFFAAPIYICINSINWLYEVNNGKYTAWKKFLFTIGIILLVLLGTEIIRLFTNWVLGIL